MEPLLEEQLKKLGPLWALQVKMNWIPHLQLQKRTSGLGQVEPATFTLPEIPTRQDAKSAEIAIRVATFEVETSSDPPTKNFVMCSDIFKFVGH